jgi:hypothetical protein
MNTIVRIHNKGPYQAEEYQAGEAGIYPGMLLSVNSDNKVIKHASSGAVAERLFAAENALFGKDVDDVYANADTVNCMLGQRGTVINAKLVAGINYTVGMKLISDGYGRLTYGTSTDVIGVIVDSACDLSDSDAVDTLHPVRLI